MKKEKIELQILVLALDYEYAAIHSPKDSPGYDKAKMANDICLSSYSELKNGTSIDELKQKVERVRNMFIEDPTEEGTKAYPLHLGVMESTKKIINLLDENESMEVGI